MPAYTIRGRRPDGTSELLATAETARTARTHYTDALETFQHVVVSDGDGREIDPVELYRLAEQERGDA